MKDNKSLSSMKNVIYSQISNISRASVGNRLVDHSVKQNYSPETHITDMG